MRIPTHLLIAGSAWASRVVIGVIQLISVRILIEGLGTEQYAVFALLTSLMGWFTLADMGVGFTLQNYISEQRVKSQPYNNYLAMSAVLAIVLLLLTITFLYFISPYIAPVFLKNFTFLGESEKIRHFFVTGSLFIAMSIGGIVYKVWYAEQKGYLANIIPAIGAVIALGGIWLVVQSAQTHRLFWSLVAFISPTSLLALISYLWHITGVSKSNWRNINRATFNIFIRRALQFWFFAIMAAVVLQIDYVVISQFVEERDIIVYNITSKVYLLAAFVYSAVLTALWPVCTEMIARNNWQNVTYYLKRYVSYGLSFMVLSTFLIANWMPIIMKILSPTTDIIVPVMFIFLFGAYHIIRVWTDTFAMVLQSMSDLKPFWKWVPLQAIASVLLQWILAPAYGIYGIILGLMCSYVITVTWALPVVVYRHVRNSKGCRYEY